MKSFKWLHLTDLHFGHPDQDIFWPNVRDAFLDNLEILHAKTGPWHAVLFSGDLVHSGTESEFSRIDNEVLQPIWNRLGNLGSGDAILLAVPGNHDLHRPNANKPTAALRQLIRKDGFGEISKEFWADPSSEYRQIINDSLKNYTHWWNNTPFRKKVVIQEGSLPGDFTTSLEVNSPGSPIRVGIAGLNTTFLQLTSGNYEGRLAWNTHQLSKPCNGDIPAWCKAHDFCLLMTHQGPTWLDQESRTEIAAEIVPAGRFAAHIFGHMHENVLRTFSSGSGPFQRNWQGRALFGLNTFGEGQRNKRSHGYSVGQIEIGNGHDATIRFWPKTAVRDTNGWRFTPDHESCVLNEADGSTIPEAIPLINPISKKPDAPKKYPHDDHHSLPRPHSELWPAKEENLREYCTAIAHSHSQIRFVEIPLQKDLPPVQLDSLYVEPRLSTQEIHPDLHPRNWPSSMAAVTALSREKALVVLGDPGSGKSTLISCLAWQLCRPAPMGGNQWFQAFGGCVPIPMILRELRLKTDLTWEGLLDAFLEHHTGKLLKTRSVLESLLKGGRAIVLLDGLDEIGNLTVRRKLRDAVHAGMSTYTTCRWILTSRIIGYDAVPFHLRVDVVPANSDIEAELIHAKGRTKTVRSKVAEVCYLAPFSDEQISDFAKNWYSQHELDQGSVAQNGKDFIEAISENEGTQRLARIPYLLTLMALIYHKNARLPHGRTELYERIATAYLEQIDLRRHLDQLPYSLSQKKRWLAEVAYKMQEQRSKKSDGTTTSQILATKSSVKRWMRAAMKSSSGLGTEEEVDILLDYFAKRSGLLLPRGEGMFAFMHLSLQEYFAACYVEPKLTASRFSAHLSKQEPSDQDLYAWANHEAWRETFVLLFEMMSQKSVMETEGFLAHLFQSRFKQGSSISEATATGLLAEVSTNPFVFLKAETRRRCLQNCWRWVLAQKPRKLDGRAFEPFPNLVVRCLLREANGDLLKSWNSASITKRELKNVETLDLTGCANLADLSSLSFLPKLKKLILKDCVNVTDIAPIASLQGLEVLNIQGCNVVGNQFQNVTGLTNLYALTVGNDIDLNLVGSLTQIQELHLHYPNAANADLTPLAGLSKLDYLCVPTRERELTISKELRENPDKINSMGLRAVLERNDSNHKLRQVRGPRFVRKRI